MLAILAGGASRRKTALLGGEMSGLPFERRYLSARKRGPDLRQELTEKGGLVAASAALVITPQGFRDDARRQRHFHGQVFKQQCHQPNQRDAVGAACAGVQPFAPLHERTEGRAETGGLRRSIFAGLGRFVLVLFTDGWGWGGTSR